jgi:hypothetical protein
MTDITGELGPKRQCILLAVGREIVGPGFSSGLKAVGGGG